MTTELLASTSHTPLPDVFLRYQQELWEAVDHYQVVVEEKSRRTGFSWAVAAIAAAYAASTKIAGGMDVLYMGYEKDMTREFIGYVAMWAEAMQQVCSEVEEFVFTDPERPEKSVGAYRVKFASGFEVIALPSVARALRGKQGLVILDEAAFMDDLDAVLKAAFALLIWGGKVVIISTHNGETNPFNVLVKEIRAGRKHGFHLMRCTFDDAIADGLYKRICLTQLRIPWTAEGEAAWRAETLAIYGDNADEELHVIPSPTSGVYLSGVLLEARAVERDVVERWKAPVDFERASEDRRRIEVQRWIQAELVPALAKLDPTEAHVLGEDFGRIRDLTVLWVLAIGRDLVRRTRLVVELRKMPFRQQEQVLFAVCDVLPRFRAAKLDGGGNGMFLAEVAVTRYGSRVESVQLSEPWYREHMAPMKAAIEDATMTLPVDDQVLDDLRMLRLVRGVGRVPDRRRDDDGAERHGDAAIACCLAHAASRADVEEYGYRPIARPVRSMFNGAPADAWLGEPPTRGRVPGRMQERAL